MKKIGDPCQVFYLFTACSSVNDKKRKMFVFAYSIFSHFICVSSYKSTLLTLYYINLWNLLGKQELIMKIVNEVEIGISFTVTIFTVSCWI